MFQAKRTTVILIVLFVTIFFTCFGLYVDKQNKKRMNFDSFDYKYIAQIYEEVEKLGGSGTFLVFRDGTLMMMTGSMEKNVISYRLPPNQSSKIHVRKFEDKDFWMINKVVRKDNIQWTEIAQSYLGVLR